MKVIGGVFIIMLVMVGAGVGVGKAWYGKPTRMCAVTMVSASASSTACSWAQALVTQHQHVSLYSSQACSLLQQEMPALKKVTVHRHSAGFHLSLIQQKPICLINQEQVLTADGALVSKDQFVPTVVQQLFAYRVASQDSLQNQQHVQEQVRFARTFDTDMLQDYTVSWIDWSRIELVDKQDTTVRMIVSADMTLSPDLVKAYQEVKKEIKSIPVGKKGRVWQVDMRFKNQILVC